ncbi:MAG: transporter substrate-binding domain-containing protein, partial [Actinobacteria bacterium]|nr:transporter substrate-binding domain-containing protein [Actinomycetota bacterium]
AALRPYRLGAQLGTTSYQYIVDNIRPSSRPLAYRSNDLAVQALKNGQIDGIVVDLPTAFFVTAVQVEDGAIVGQFPNRGGRERFGMVFRAGQLPQALHQPRAQPPLGERTDQAAPDPLALAGRRRTRHQVSTERRSPLAHPEHRGHRSRAGNATRVAPARRGHERARPRAGGRGARGRARARSRGNDDADRHARDGLRPRRRPPGLLPRRRRDPGAKKPGADLRSAARARTQQFLQRILDAGRL